MDIIVIKGASQPDIVFQAFLEESSQIIPLIESFLEIPELHSNISLEDEKSLSSTLHKLRGSSGFIGFNELNESTKKSEIALKDKRSTLSSSLKEVITHIKEIEDEIKSKISKGAND